MAVLRCRMCKMCGGDIVAEEGQSFGRCEKCGNLITLPAYSDQRIENLFNRANHLRMTYEFDRAIETYNMILSENYENAEAHWGLLLSKYGIEYLISVPENKHSLICHRLHQESILTDEDYCTAIEFAPDETIRNLFEQQGKELARLQQDLLDVSMQASSCDIFICYESESSSDALIAQSISDQLNNAGYQVFASKRAKGDGLDYQEEPYTFAALNNAKVMLVIGTTAQCFNDVWVKNEWKRYIALMKTDTSRMIISCYRDMSIYDLPDELSAGQNLDLSGGNFLQTILSIIRNNVPAQSQNSDPASKEIQAQIKRAFLCLNDGEFNTADSVLERVLDRQPENAEAYLGKLMIEFQAKKEADLASSSREIKDSINYRRAVQYGSKSLVARLQRYNHIIQKRNRDEHILWAKSEVIRLQNKLNDEVRQFDAEISNLQIGVKTAEENVQRAKDNLEQAQQQQNKENDNLQNYQEKNSTPTILIIAAVIFVILFALLYADANRTTGPSILGPIGTLAVFIALIAVPISAVRRSKRASKTKEDEVKKQGYVLDNARSNVNHMTELLTGAEVVRDQIIKQCQDKVHEKDIMVRSYEEKIGQLEKIIEEE